MTPTDLAALVEAMRDRLADAHRHVVVAMKEPGRSPTEDSLLDAVRLVAGVTADLIDLCIDLNDRVPMSTEAFGEILGGK